MKITQLTTLKHKLQWLLLLTALLGVSQGVWGYTLYVNSNSGDYYTYAYDFAGGDHTGEALGGWRGKQFNNTTYFEKIGNNWYKLNYTTYTSGKVIFNQDGSGQTSDITLPSSDAFYTYDGNNTFSTLSTSGKYQSYYSILYLSTAEFTGWENDGATFKAHLYTNSDCSDRHYIKTVNFSATGCPHEYSASISTDLPVLGIKIERFDSSGSSAWNNFTISGFSASNNGAKVTDWNAGEQYKATDHATEPTVTSTAAASITSTTATLGGNVTDAGQTASCGTQTVTARGIEWVSGTGKTAGTKEAAAAGGTGSYTVDITGLSAGTSYTYKAYATNAAGTSYGSNTSFTTTASCSDPIITVQPSGSWQKCGNDTGRELSITATGGSGTLTYQWFRNTTNTLTDGVADLTGATAVTDMVEGGNTYSPSASDYGKFYYCCVVRSGGACSANKATSVYTGEIEIKQTPTVKPSTITVKQYEPVRLQATNSSVNWSITAYPGGAAADEYYLYDETKNSAMFKGKTGSYTVTATSTGSDCTSTSTITVNNDDSEGC